MVKASNGIVKNGEEEDFAETPTKFLELRADNSTLSAEDLDPNDQ
jgi:hypothetical protein